MTNNKTIHRLSLLLLVAAVGLRVAFFAISITRVQPTADESIAQLQAEQVMRGDFPVLFMAQPYLFPLESYLAAPFTPLLPNTAFGARIIPVIIHLIAASLALLILRRMYSTRLSWVGGILILFPSSYFLMMQSAYALPGYSALPLLCFAATLTAIAPRKGYEHHLAMAALTGLLSGLAFASHMLSLPFIIPIAVYLCVGTDWKSALRNSAGFITGITMGLLPYLLTKWSIPGAHASVTDSHSVAVALSRLWSPAIKWTLTAGLGIRTSLFPDDNAINYALLPATLFGILWATLIILLIAMRGFAFIKRSIKNRWPSLEPIDIFVGVAILTLMAFTLSKRADSSSCRYLLPLIMSFPFLINHLHQATHRIPRTAITLLALFLVGWNMIASALLMGHWLQPNFSVSHAGAADLTPVIETLREKGIQHCVASYGTAYRTTFQSAGDITASQPMNERFPGWPLPYWKEVNASDNVAYVLTDTVRFLKPSIFDRHLRTMGIASEKSVCGDYSIYTNFRETNPRQLERALTAADLDLSASHNQAATTKLSDGILDNRWTTEHLQEQGMWVKLHLKTPTELSRLRIYYGRYFHDHAPEMKMLITTQTGETNTLEGITGFIDKFAFENNHPSYGTIARHTLELPKVTATAMELQISSPNPHMAWTLCELEILHIPQQEKLP